MSPLTCIFFTNQRKEISLSVEYCAASGYCSFPIEDCPDEVVSWVNDLPRCMVHDLKLHPFLESMRHAALEMLRDRIIKGFDSLPEIEETLRAYEKEKI